MKKIISLILTLGAALSLMLPMTAASYTDELSVNGVKVEASSVNENNGTPCEVAENVLDGDTKTTWHSMINPKAEGPHWLTLILPDEETVTGYRYYPRGTGSAGICTKYEIQVSSDGKKYTTVASGTWDNQNGVKEARFNAVKAKYVKLVILEGNADYGSAGEVRLIGPAGVASTVKNAEASSTGVGTGTTETKETAASDTAATVGKADELSVNGVKVEASSVNENNGTPCEVAENVLDGDTKTIWHSMINPKAEGPHWLTLILPDEETVTGYRYYPRATGSAGVCTKYEIQTSKDGKNYTTVASGTWDNQNGVKEARFNAVKAKYVKLVILEGNGGYGSAGEVRLIGPGGGASADKENTSQGMSIKPGELGDEVTPLNWKFEASSVNVNNGVPWELPKYVADGDTSSTWHSLINPKAEAPHYLTIILPRTEIISGYRYYPRATGTAGVCTKYEIWVSTDGENYSKEAEGNWNNDKTAKTAYFKENVPAKYVKLVMLEGDAGYGSAGEVRVLKKDESLKTRNGAQELDSTVLQEDETSVKGWVVTASSVNENNGKPTELAEYLIDGNLSSIWHSMINPKAEGPHYVTAVFPEEEYISGFRYYPRANGTAGICKEYEIYVSADGKNFTKVSEGTWNYDKTVKETDFFINIKAKAIKFVLTNSEAGYGSGGEIRTLKAKLNYDNVDAATYEKEIGQYKIKPVLFDSMKITTSLDNVLKSTPGVLSDGESASLWETTAMDGTFMGPTVDIDYEFGYPYTIKGIEYTPRQDDNYHGKGHVEKMEVYTSDNGTDYTLFDTVTIDVGDDLKATKYAFFKDEIQTKHLRFRVLECYGDYVAIADIRFLQTEGQNSIENTLDEETYILTVGSNEIKVRRGTEEKVVTTDAAPYIYKGSTMIPLRGLLTEMGAEVAWNGDIQRIDVKSDKGDMVFEIESYMVYVDSVRYTCPVAPQITDSRTFIPLRFISENMGYNVYWNGETQEIKITNK